MSLSGVITVVSSTVVVADDPNWGCGFVGVLPGINPDGSTSSEMQRMIDGVKSSSSYNKVNYWNWGLAPQADDGKMEYLSEDFIFMPEQWGVGVVHDADLQPAGQVGIKDAAGGFSKATMATILMGANEPDQTGSCMGNMMGQCIRACTDDEIQAGACPVAHLKGEPAEANPIGHCDCWSDSHATGSGFWSVGGCIDPQPLPNLWEDKICTREVMNAWKVTSAIAVKKGYQYLSTPLIAANMDWLESFVQTACDGCSDVSCGCPTHIAWHFYANDCRPEELGGYADFQNKLDKSKAIMEKFPHIKGAIINEIGMLNCVMNADNGFACVPNSADQKFPANQQPGNTCPSTDELPNGMGTFLERLLEMVANAKTSDGRRVVKSVAWFNENQSGGTYDLRLLDDDGTVNHVGESYMKGCQAWANSMAEDVVV